MLAVAGPVAGSEHQVGDFPEACVRAIRVRGLKREQSPRKPQVPTRRRRIPKGADCSELVLEAIVIREMKAKNDRSRHRRAVDHIDPDRLAAMIDDQMFPGGSAYAAHLERPRVEEPLARFGRRRGARDKDARVHGRRPYRKDAHTIPRRVLSESAVPNA